MMLLKRHDDELVQKVNAIYPTDTSKLIKKLNLTQKLVKLKRKDLTLIMVTALEFYKLTAEYFAARLAQAKLVTQ